MAKTLTLEQSIDKAFSPLRKYVILRAIKHLEAEPNCKWSRDVRDAITLLECEL